MKLSSRGNVTLSMSSPGAKVEVPMDGGRDADAEDAAASARAD